MQTSYRMATTFENIEQTLQTGRVLLVLIAIALVVWGLINFPVLL